MLNVTITDTEQVPLQINFTDAKGHTTTPATAPTWASSDPTIVAVTPSADGTSAIAAAAANLGVAQVTVTSVVNGETLTAVVAITVLAGAAVIENITAGVPVEQPAPVATPDPTPAPAPADPTETAPAAAPATPADPTETPVATPAAS